MLNFHKIVVMTNTGSFVIVLVSYTINRSQSIDRNFIHLANPVLSSICNWVYIAKHKLCLPLLELVDRLRKQLSKQDTIKCNVLAVKY